MNVHRYRHALLPTGWSPHVEFTLKQGQIERIETRTIDDVVADSWPAATAIAVPGMANVHSHAFQYAFAGLSEYRTQTHDSFWTWRQQMYQFLQSLTPDDVYDIGKRLYAVMRQVGYCAVGEFHYLHHQPNGQPYDQATAMGDALIQAALDVGMKICLLPVLYQRGGFDGRPLEGGQLRFGSGHDTYLAMLEKLVATWLPHASVRIGMAIHSLRAVSIESARRAITDVTQLIGECPIHIHIAEQVQEVDECWQTHKLRPVELLLESFEVGPRWCLIHATHLTPAECVAVAASQAVVGVCPTTEANLGDGVFMAERFLQAQGRLAIGSDSQISLDPCEELRLLEYAQRLTQQRRAVLCTDGESCGQLLYRWTASGGASALGFGPGSLDAHQSDMIGVIDTSDVTHVPLERILDYAIFHSAPTQRLLSAL